MTKKEKRAMTVGESIKNHRSKCGLTQKDLSEKLNVSFQTVSKWENDTNEPDVNTLKAMCKIFDCTLDDLIDNETGEAKKETKNTEGNVLIGTCRDCGKQLFSSDEVHHMERKSSGGIKETVLVCDECFKHHEELNKQRAELLKAPEKKKSKSKLVNGITSRDDSKVIIWSLIIGAAALLTTLILCICFYKDVGLGWTIGLPLIIGYVLLADIYCIFSASWVSEVFVGIASWSIKFPGVIFSLDLGGIAFLIIVKILFWIIGALVGIATLIFAVIFASVCSIFTFPFLLIYNKNNYV